MANWNRVGQLEPGELICSILQRGFKTLTRLSQKEAEKSAALPGSRTCRPRSMGYRRARPSAKGIGKTVISLVETVLTAFGSARH